LQTFRIAISNVLLETAKELALTPSPGNVVTLIDTLEKLYTIQKEWGSRRSENWPFNWAYQPQLDHYMKIIRSLYGPQAG
jgi:hypothetical protein